MNHNFFDYFNVLVVSVVPWFAVVYFFVLFVVVFFIVAVVVVVSVVWPHGYELGAVSVLIL